MKYKQRFSNQGRHAAAGTIYVHVLVAERALGRELPAGAEVHHVDGTKLNNENSNLVICQDVAYHKLLHYRASVIARGGNPNTERWCGDCEAFLPFSAFNKSSANKSIGLQTVCRSCQSERFRQFRQQRKAAS